VSWTILGGAVGLAAVISVPVEQHTRPGRKLLKHGNTQCMRRNTYLSVLYCRNFDDTGTAMRKHGPP